MEANQQFKNLPKSFWATVKTVSQKTGYTVRGQGIVKIPSAREIMKAFIDLDLDPEEIIKNNEETNLTKILISYYSYRADVLNTFVEPRLMNAARAQQEFELLHSKFPQYGNLIPMNKQKGDKQAPAFFTAIINILIASNSEGFPFDHDPRELTTVTINGAPLRTLSRRVDGAFPSAINPKAIWEIKEYYYTTTFGSRVADGVYETLLDGMELEELHEHENIKVFHYLMIDAHFTWWECGKSYLCRIIDMLHMGYVDEVLFGYEVIERLPSIVHRLVAEQKEIRLI